MDTLSHDPVAVGRNIPTATTRTGSRRNFWDQLVLQFQRALCAYISCGEPLTMTVGMNLVRLEREVFVFAAPFSSHYQELNGKSRGE